MKKLFVVLAACLLTVVPAQESIAGEGHEAGSIYLLGLVYTLLTAFLGLLIIRRTRPTQREWFLVESRRCWDESLTTLAFIHDTVLDAEHLQREKLTIVTSGLSTSFLKSEHGKELSIFQCVFESIEPARLYGEQLARLMNGGDAYAQIFLRRVVACDREKAFTLPPASYLNKDMVTLLRWPRLYHKPKK